MRYRLKNQALQAALDKATNGAFSELLIDCEGVEIEVNGVKLEIEMDPVKEFDPTKWNEWPGVEPPRDVPLRLEVREPDEDLDTPEPRFGKIRKKACACFDGNDWFYWPGRSFSSYISIGKGDVVRFRPWVGPDEEDVE